MDKRLGGDIAGPGGPHDRGKVVISSEGALLPDYQTFVAFDPEHGAPPDELLVGLLFEGRINKTQDRAKVLVVLNDDGIAALISEAVALLGRGDRKLTASARVILAARLDKLDEEGLLDRIEPDEEAADGG